MWMSLQFLASADELREGDIEAQGPELCNESLIACVACGLPAYDPFAKFAGRPRIQKIAYKVNRSIAVLS